MEESQQVFIPCVQAGDGFHNARGQHENGARIRACMLDKTSCRQGNSHCARLEPLHGAVRPAGKSWVRTQEQFESDQFLFEWRFCEHGAFGIAATTQGECKKYYACR